MKKQIKTGRPFPTGAVRAEYALTTDRQTGRKLRAYRVLERHMDKDGGGKNWCCYEAIVHLQPYCNNGELAVVETPKGLMYGRFYRRSDIVEIRADNAGFLSAKFPASSVTIVGEVDGFDSCPDDRKRAAATSALSLADMDRKRFVVVGGFGVRVEVDEIGLLHVVVRSMKGGEAIMVDHPSSGLAEGREHSVYTNDLLIVDWELDHGDDYGDFRVSPNKLRKAAKSKTFCAWWSLTRKETPEQYADLIDDVRRREKDNGHKAGSLGIAG